MVNSLTRPSYRSLSEVKAKNVLLNVVNVNLAFSRTTWARKCEPTHFFPQGAPSSHRVECGEYVWIWLISFYKKTNTTHTNIHPHTLQRPSRPSVWRRQACESKTVNISKAIGIHYSIIQHRELKVSGWDWAFIQQAGGGKKKKTALHGYEQRQQTATCAEERMSERLPSSWVDSTRWKQKERGIFFRCPSLDGGWYEG